MKKIDLISIIGLVFSTCPSIKLDQRDIQVIHRFFLESCNNRLNHAQICLYADKPTFSMIRSCPDMFNVIEEGGYSKYITATENINTQFFLNKIDKRFQEEVMTHITNVCERLKKSKGITR